MSAGFSFVSDYGTQIIDQNFCMLEYRGKYTVTLSPTGTVTTPGYQGEVLAIGASDYPVAIVGRSGNTWSLRSVGAAPGSSIPSQMVTVYLFALPDQVSPVSHSGLIVYTAEGLLAFNSAKNYMRVVQVASGSNSALSISAAQGNYAAVAAGSPASGVFVKFEYDGTYYKSIWQMVPAIKVTQSTAALSMGSTYLVGTQQNWSGSSGALLRPTGSATLALIDVSGL